MADAAGLARRLSPRAGSPSQPECPGENTLAHDRDRKLPLYARFAVPEVWLVDLACGHLDVYRNPEDGAYTTRFRVQDLSCVGIGALPDLALDLRSLF